eukprot:8432739-Alexandrium_andersonii.AAC.1
MGSVRAVPGPLASSSRPGRSTQASPMPTQDLPWGGQANLVYRSVLQTKMGVNIEASPLATRC